MIKLLASDIDGTIVYKDNMISHRNIETIEKLNKTNIIFVISTGKTYLLMKELCKKINADYGIFGNGTQIINLKTGKELERNAIKKQKVEKSIEIANKNNLHVHIYTDKKIIAQNSLDYMAYRNYILYKDSVDFEIVKNLKQYAKDNNIEADFYLGSESGITNNLGKWMIVNIGVIEDNNGIEGFGASPAFPVPDKYVDEIIKTDLGKVMDKLFSEENLAKGKGGVSLLTKDVISRIDQTEEAFVMALTEHINGDLWR